MTARADDRLRTATFSLVGLIALVAAGVTRHPGWIAAAAVAVLGLLLVLARRRRRTGATGR